MKWLTAALCFVNFSTLCGLLFGAIGGGLNGPIAFFSLALGIVIAIGVVLTMPGANANAVRTDQSTEQLSKRAQFRQRREAAAVAAPTFNYRRVWFWLVACCFAIFAFRSFCWLLFLPPNENGELKIQSPNNLGDLALHITFIKNFANGAPLWPDNPIYVFSKLRYPAGIDLFNALLCCLDVDLVRGLVWVGLLASFATFYAFYRWGGTFAVAGFLFNGGLAIFKDFQFFRTFEFKDYQAQGMAWKSIPLAMFVTQRGLLYAIPAGLLLLWSWRQRFFRSRGNQSESVNRQSNASAARTSDLPFWIEFALYASMPLFHLHTFVALSIVLLFLFAFGDLPIRVETAKLVACAFLPATFFVWLTTDHFHATSVIGLKPGLLERTNEFARHYFMFWPINLGLWLPLAALLVGLCLWRAWNSELPWTQKLPENLSFLLPAAAIFVLSDFVKMAPWEWDNLKVMVWAYFLLLPFLWTDLIAKWTAPARVAVCILLFASGFVSLFGGLAAGRPGYTFANRGEIDAVGVAVSKLPIEARFAAFPVYNHPLLLQGRKVVLGYPGHLWTLGFDYEPRYVELGALMQGEGDWQAIARDLDVRYIFWGNEERTNYSTSARPWEKTFSKIQSGNWGAIYDLQAPLVSH